MAIENVSVVLAHGAWADGSSWARVITALRAESMKVSAAPLPLTSLRDERAVLAGVQRPISLDCITVPVGRPLWKDIPSWFLLAEEDRMIAPDTQRYMAKRMKAIIRPNAVDHTPSVTTPGVVVDTIREA